MSYANTTKVCDHLSLGVCHCTSTTTIGEAKSIDSSTKRKLVEQATDGATKKIINDKAWKIRKVLKNSDVNRSSRLLLGKTLVEDFMLPVLGVNAMKEEEEIEVKICDIYTNSSVHSLKLKRWCSGSYVLKEGWAKGFVARKGLQKGDEIGLCWNQYNLHFDFFVLSSNKNKTLDLTNYSITEV
ncbi:B3 domain-containing protein At2g33720-like [Trifolium pratense]|uniref:B3 domain-containing protein At2g33720-like n=1 Tax=Trifolium pratense TaxID=57577 RepID=UPI001E696A37|nr:B3 domain-containing protein At2g33720-like [Trifolium pratense]